MDKRGCVVGMNTFIFKQTEGINFALDTIIDKYVRKYDGVDRSIGVKVNLSPMNRRLGQAILLNPHQYSED